MAERDGQPQGGELLAAISDAIVRIHKDHYGKGPTKARTLLAEDMVVTRLDDVFTKAERTLVGVGREDEVKAMRIAFQMALEDEFVGAVEHLVGRKVQAFISDLHPQTGMAIELFVLEPEGEPADPSAKKKREP